MTKYQVTWDYPQDKHIADLGEGRVLLVYHGAVGFTVRLLEYGEQVRISFPWWYLDEAKHHAIQLAAGLGWLD